MRRESRIVNRFLTVNEVCQLLGIGRSTFYRLLDDKASGFSEITLRIPGLRGIRMEEQAVRDWMTGQKTS